MDNQVNGDILIKAGQFYTAKKEFFTKVLSKVEGDIYICDPYLGVGTLDLLSDIDKKHKIKFLTENIEKAKARATGRLFYPSICRL